MPIQSEVSTQDVAKSSSELIRESDIQLFADYAQLTKIPRKTLALWKDFHCSQQVRDEKEPPPVLGYRRHAAPGRDQAC